RVISFPHPSFHNVLGPCARVLHSPPFTKLDKFCQGLCLSLYAPLVFNHLLHLLPSYLDQLSVNLFNSPAMCWIHKPTSGAGGRWPMYREALCALTHRYRFLSVGPPLNLTLPIPFLIGAREAVLNAAVRVERIAGVIHDDGIRTVRLKPKRPPVLLKLAGFAHSRL